MQPIRIDIPDSLEFDAAGILLTVFEQEGIDARKAAGIPLIQTAIRMWIHREDGMNEARFRDILQKVLILNPGVANECPGNAS